MLKSLYQQIDTPALLIDMDRVLENLREMQGKADHFKVALRPHTKTHKMPSLAKLQVDLGAKGITVAKLAEAEVMSRHGMRDIFIANQIVGEEKLSRLRKLSEQSFVVVGIDNVAHVAALNTAFTGSEAPVHAMIEVEVGENRCGVNTEAELLFLAEAVSQAKNVLLEGVFAHEGHTYSAKDITAAVDEAIASQEKLVHFAKLLRSAGHRCATVSIGATPSLLHSDIIPGITEIRPGTYIFRDVGQAGATGTFSRCAATVLATVISKPTEERVVVDAGAKALTMQRRIGGICHTEGFGTLKGDDSVRLVRVFDEHGILNDARVRSSLCIGDKVEVIPNHICPTVNLYDNAVFVSRGEILGCEEISCRGKIT